MGYWYYFSSYRRKSRRESESRHDFSFADGGRGSITIFGDCCGLLRWMIRWRYHDVGKLGSGQQWASLFYEQLKKSPASPMPPLPLSATAPLLSPLKKMSKPALLLSLSFVPAQKSSIPLHSPQQLLQKSLKKAYVCTAPNALSMRGCWRIFIYYRADITHPFITKRPPRFFFSYWERVHGDWVTSLPIRFGHPKFFSNFFLIHV